MIFGQVNSLTEAVIAIEVLNYKHQTSNLETIVDTGFSGYLTLPFNIISTLDLPLIETRPYSLGNNQRVDFDLYAVTVIWNGNERQILALASDSFPLIGMSLLKGYRITIDALDGGKVLIEEIP